MHKIKSIKVINAGNCIMCGREIKIDANIENDKFPNILFCPECNKLRLDMLENIDKNTNVYKADNIGARN